MSSSYPNHVKYTTRLSEIQVKYYLMVFKMPSAMATAISSNRSSKRSLNAASWRKRTEDTSALSWQDDSSGSMSSQQDLRSLQGISMRQSGSSCRQRTTASGRIALTGHTTTPTSVLTLFSAENSAMSSYGTAS